MTETATLELTERQAEVLANLEQVGANIPPEAVVEWNSFQLEHADRWSDAMYRAANGHEVLTELVTAIPDSIYCYLPTEAQRDPVAYVKDIAPAETDLKESADAVMETIVELPERLDRLNRYALDIQAAERHVAEAEADWDARKKEAKEAKEEFDVSVTRLRSLVRKDPNQKELFDGQDNDDPATAAETKAADDWGKESVLVLNQHGLTTKQTEKVEAALLAQKREGTVRGLRDWNKADDLWMTKIKGIGKETIDKVSDALNSYYRANPEAVKDDESNGDGTGKTAFEADGDD